MENDSVNETGVKKVSSQAGYLPVPLRHVPPESLSSLQVYLFNPKGRNYSLYRDKELAFGKKDYERLLESQVEFVYVSVQDHRAYYRAMEKAIKGIVADPQIQAEKKAEILYSTSMELAHQLLDAPPGREEIKRTTELASTTVQMIMNDKRAFGRLFEVFNHDFYTATHMVNVCNMVISMGCKMGLTDGDILRAAGTGGLLHDVGKIFIPDEVLNTTKPLSPEQVELVKSHVQRGQEHLMSVASDLPQEVFAIVGEHHERNDGSGYPRGLTKEKITPLGRLAGIVDSFEAMISVRPYREHTYSVEEALGEIINNAPEKYDLEISQAFTSMIEDVLRYRSGDTDGGAETTEKDAEASPRIACADVSGPKHTRLYFRISVLVQRMEKRGGKLVLGDQERMIAHRISRSGMGLLSPRPMVIDQNILIRCGQFEHINLSKFTAVVSNCREHGDGWFTVDVQFHRPQDSEDIERIKQATAAREVSALVDT